MGWSALREHWQQERAQGRGVVPGSVTLEVFAGCLALLVAAVPLNEPPAALRVIVLAPAVVAFVAAWRTFRGFSRRWLTASACMTWLVVLLLLPMFLFGALFIPSAAVASLATFVGRGRPGSPRS